MSSDDSCWRELKNEIKITQEQSQLVLITCETSEQLSSRGGHLILIRLDGSSIRFSIDQQ